MFADAGSIPVHVTGFGEVVELVDTRRSERRALAAWEFDSPLRHSVQAWQVPGWSS